MSKVAESTRRVAVLFKKKVAISELQERLERLIVVSSGTDRMFLIELRERFALIVEALEHCRWRPHEHNPSSAWTGPVKCDVIDRALGI